MSIREFRGETPIAEHTRIVLLPAGDLAPGEMVRVVVAEHAPFAVYNIAGTFHVTADTCTHSLASLTEGDLEGTRVVCPVHWAEFDVPTGRALCFPATEPLATYPVAVEDGVVVAYVPPRDGEWTSGDGGTS